MEINRKKEIEKINEENQRLLTIISHARPSIKFSIFQDHEKMHKYYKKLTNRYKRIKDLVSLKTKETIKKNSKESFLPYLKNEKRVKIINHSRSKQFNTLNPHKSKENLEDRTIINEQYLTTNIKLHKKSVIKEVQSLKFSNIGTVTEASTKSTTAFNQKKKKHKHRHKKERTSNSQIVCNSPSSTSIPTSINQHLMLVDLKSIQEEKTKISVINHKRKGRLERKKSGTQTVIRKAYQ